MEGRWKVAAFMTLALAAMLNSSSAQTTHVVGDSLGWLVPPGGEVAYQTWAASKTFSVGDVLVFNFTTGIHDAAEALRFGSETGHQRLRNLHSFRTTARHSTASAYTGNHPITGRANNSSASRYTCTLPRAAMTFTVGDSLGWLVPPGGPIAYQTWARGKPFLVGDILAPPPPPPITTSPARITLTSAGEHYYICTFTQHCNFGQKLAINVSAAGSPATPPSGSAPAPSSAATPPPASSPTPPPRSSGPAPATPSTPSTQPPVTAPPPPSNSAPSLTVAALPFTFLAAAMVFLYN
ncbi:UNVERIFIED_CONTAM: hypothetical protein Sradi_2021800 [Sesamum radiatum]|uniref:Phytocyanin domain-containing protein n=1 Tax=Sesamum radiatum TaxID=300843 RepID=A0AAW2TFT3_SESRA